VNCLVPPVLGTLHESFCVTFIEFLLEYRVFIHFNPSIASSIFLSDSRTCFKCPFKSLTAFSSMRRSFFVINFKQPTFEELNPLKRHPSEFSFLIGLYTFSYRSTIRL